jgi:hypothetical protein
MKKLYVIVNKDIPCSLPAVQAGHVVAEFCLKNINAKEWNNSYLIYLEVHNESQLKYWRFKFHKRNIDITSFREPDINNNITAFCALLDEEEAKFLSKLNLLT